MTKLDKNRYDEKAFAEFLREHSDTVEYGDYRPTLDENGEEIGAEIEVWVHGAEEGMSHWYVDADFLEEIFGEL